MLRKHFSIKQLRLWALGAAGSVLLGCAATPTPTSIPDLPSSELLQQAINAEALGNYVLAAQSYLQLTEQSEGVERGRHQIQAARLLQKGQLSGQADAVIGQINTRQFNLADQVKLRLLKARIALSRQQPEEALQSLRLSAAMVPAELKSDWHGLRAEAYSQVGNHLEATREYVLLEPHLQNPEAIAENHEQIWSTLSPINAGALLNLRMDPPPDIMSGWLELNYLYKSSVDAPEQLRDELVAWQARYPIHPADSAFLESLLLRQYAELELPEHIALLLPLSGQFAKPAKAVRDGFMAAYYDRSDARFNPEIRIYDTGGDLITGLNAYHQAISEGAELVVGPLHKPLLEHLVEVTEFPVPTLALNYLGDASTSMDNLYQYGLSPEDEARQVAERAWLEGYNNALVLTPSGDWGERMVSTFSQHWQQMDGKLLEVQHYDASKHDFARPVVDLLNIDESRQRQRELKQLIDLPIQFEPRRRQDIDFIYIAAFPGQARQIRPQLKFYYAGDIPVFSTSHLYTGEPDATLDRDMDGIQFCDMPWVFNAQQDQALNWQNFAAIWGSNAKPFKRLYAMGIDAFQLIGKLERLAKNPQQQLAAQSGRLYLDSNRRVHRQLQWAQFVSGTPRPIDSPDPHLPPES